MRTVSFACPTLASACKIRALPKRAVRLKPVALTHDSDNAYDSTDVASET